MQNFAFKRDLTDHKEGLNLSESLSKVRQTIMQSITFLNMLLIALSTVSYCCLANGDLVGHRVHEITTAPLQEDYELAKETASYEDYPTLYETQSEEVKAKICNPMLNWAPTQSNNLSSNINNDDHNTQKVQPNKLEADKVSLTFAIPDIDVPVSPANSSLNSAIKFISAFDNPFGLDNGNSESSMESVVKFRENQLNIVGLNLSMLNIHLFPNSDPKFGLGLIIKNTILTGQFSYNGPLLLTDSKLAGFYRMSIDNIFLVVSSNLTKQQEIIPKRLIKIDQDRSAQSMFRLKSNDFKLNITNLGYINIEVFDSKDLSKPTTNYLLKLLQRVLQRTIKRTYYSFENYIRETLQVEGREFLDCELTRFNHLLDNKGASSHQSDLARIISSEITRSQLSSVPLPNYEHQQNILGSLATVQFYNGLLSGLNNTKLNGETRIKLQDEHLFVNTSIGWSDLRPQYNWSLIIGNSPKTSAPISKGVVAFNIKGIDFDAVITKGLRPHTRLVVDQLTIKQLDSPKMDISGLPGMNRITRGMVNFFMGRLKQRISSSIQPALKQQLERSLNKMNLFA